MNLLYCGNRGVFDGIAMSALSVIRNLKAPGELNIHIFTMDLTRINPDYTPITAHQAAVLQEHLRRRNPDTAVTLHDVTGLYEAHLGGSPNESCYCSPYTLLRLLADLEDLPGKLLYLDADVLLCRDAGEIYHRDISQLEYAAAPDRYGSRLVHPGYINAGVLLLNLEECRKTGIFQKARELIRQKKLPFADQSALIRATTRRELLPPACNEQNKCRPGTVARHFSQRLVWLPWPHKENLKPWHRDFRWKYPEFGSLLDDFEAIKEDPKWTP